MKQFFYLSVILLVTTLAVSLSKEIKSTEKGGDWFIPSTWIDAEIPGENDDVIINGNVTSNKPITCNDLTINKDASLILNTPSAKINVFKGNFTLFGCFESDENSILLFKGKITKNSKCFRNMVPLLETDE